MLFKNKPKFPSQYPIFTEGIAKKNTKQTERQIYQAWIKKIFRMGPP